MTFRLFEVHFPQKTVEVWERIMPDGKIEQYQVGGEVDGAVIHET